METVPELLALPVDLEACSVRWDGDEVSIHHPDVEQGAIFRAQPAPEASAQGGAPVATRPTELWHEERGHSFYPAPEVLAKIPGLWATILEPHEHRGVSLRYVSAEGQWYVVEVDDASGQAYGWSCLGSDRSQGRWGLIDLPVLESSHPDDPPQLVIRDLDFTPDAAANVLPKGRPHNPCGDEDCPVCPPDLMTAYVARLLSVITEHGFAIQAVLGDESSAAYCYTAGLHESLGCEFVMTGLDIGVMQGLLHSLIKRLAGSSGPVDGEALDGLLSNGFQLLMRPVASSEPFAMLRAAYGREIAVPYWQAVWPDRYGVFPTDASCSLSPGTQPLL